MLRRAFMIALLSVLGACTPFEVEENQPTPLTEGAYHSELPGSWSGDSRSVVFTSTRSGDEGLWLVDVETGALQFLGPEPDEANFVVRNPAFSPDGSFIAYEEGESEINLLVVATGEVLPLIIGGFEPCWSSDGMELYFLDETHASMYRYSFWEGRVEPWLHFDFVVDGITLSHDGSRFAFYRRFSPDSGLWAVDVDGGNLTPLVIDFPDRLKPQSSWSPDGRSLVFSTNDGGSMSGKVWILDVSDGTSEMILENGADRPIWSPNGDQIVFAQNDESFRSSLWLFLL